MQLLKRVMESVAKNELMLVEIEVLLFCVLTFREQFLHESIFRAQKRIA